MTKKLATLVAMLACCVFGALAQRVATTPVTDVQTGVYMLRMKSDRISGTDGAWVYYKDSHAWGESDNTAYRVLQLILIGLKLRADRVKHWGLSAKTTKNGCPMISR